MEIYSFINKCTKKLEFLVISTVVSFYMLSIYDTILSSHKCIPLYIICLSFYYYLILLTKSPGTLLDFNCSQIQGLCKKCNRIVGSRTVHCELCNKCYYKRDHHCIITGKCIASNNTKDLFFNLLFLFIYSILAMNRESLLKEFVFFYKYTTILSGVLLIWVGVLLTIDKTTSEFFSMDKSVYTEVELRRITGLKENGVINIVFPFLNRKVRMVEN
jgi:hypothetical protein